MADKIEITAPIEQEGTKATVRNWLRNVGDRVTQGDALVELETDKVTQEVPAPESGVLVEILMRDGDDATPGAVLGRMEADGAPPEAPVETDRGKPRGTALSAGGGEGTVAFSPAVRRAAAEYGIDPSTVTGTGKGGRVSRTDMDKAFERKSETAAVDRKPDSTARAAEQIDATHPSAHAGQAAPSAPSGLSRRVPHSAMRLAIARNMSNSLAVAPQVTAVFEADFSAIMRHRDAAKSRMKAEGVNLSYTAYIVAACVAAMKAVPEVNSQWHDDALEIFGDVNIGIGTALGDKGLVVPVIQKAQHLSLQGIAAKLQDLTTRARGNALKPEDLRGGTFTISNHGVSGSLFASPIIIAQPQSAILGVGKLEKRVVVREIDGVDTIQVRPMAYVSLTIDHRSLDGHQTNTWLSEFVRVLETWQA